MDGTDMANSWTDWIAKRLGAGHTEADEDRNRDLAVAALLVEVLRADYGSSVAERRQVIESLRGLLALDPDDCDTLLADAEHRVERAHDLHQFTSELNVHLSHPQKLALMEQLWRVARADAVVHKYEEHLIRRVADLLHVSHREFIAAKLRAGGA
jgi:uncharacterized tellurite resistance protein B-like protein